MPSQGAPERVATVIDLVHVILDQLLFRGRVAVADQGNVSAIARGDPFSTSVVNQGGGCPEGRLFQIGA
jgi:hypothetical protein